KDTYTFAGQKGNLHYFKTHRDLTLAPPKNKGGMRIAITIKWKTKGSGEMVFDVKKGRLQSLTTEVHLSGRMTVTINKKVHQTELVQSHGTEIRVMDRDPLEMKEKGPQE